MNTLSDKDKEKILTKWYKYVYRRYPLIAWRIELDGFYIVFTLSSTNYTKLYLNFRCPIFAVNNAQNNKVIEIQLRGVVKGFIKEVKKIQTSKIKSVISEITNKKANLFED